MSLLPAAAPVPSGGLAEPPPATRTCPHCWQAVPCYRPTASQYFGCPQCRHYFRAVPGEKVEVLADPLPLSNPAPPLALGSVGTLGGYRLRIVGYQLRSEQVDQAVRWTEYQLAPADATAEAAAAADPAFPLQLAEYQGHWQLIRPASSGPTDIPGRGQQWKDPNDGDRAYMLWHRYRPRILEVRGEFDENVLKDINLHVVELIAPPYQLMGERVVGTSYTWYRSHYLEPARVAAAFGLPEASLPPRIGIGASQPAPGSYAWPRLLHLAWVGGLLLLLMQALLLMRPEPVALTQEFDLPHPATVGTAPVSNRPSAIDSLVSRQYRVHRATVIDSLIKRQALAADGQAIDPAAAQALRVELARVMAQSRPSNEAYQQAYAAALATATAAKAAAPPAALVSRSFYLTGPTALALELQVPALNNNWAEVSASLVNEQTGRAYETTRAIEYYSGYEGGESWSEGDHASTASFSAVPSGRYHVNLYPTTDPANPAQGTFIVRVSVKAGIWSNFWLALGLLAAPLLVVGLRRYWFEQSRWQLSNYGPQPSE